MALTILVQILLNKMFAPFIRFTRPSVTVTTNSELPVLTGKTPREPVTVRGSHRSSGVNPRVEEDEEGEVVEVDRNVAGSPL